MFLRGGNLTLREGRRSGAVPEGTWKADVAVERSASESERTFMVCWGWGGFGVSCARTVCVDESIHAIVLYSRRTLSRVSFYDGDTL